MKLTIIRIKPNPAGKDRPPNGGPSPAQLAAEWVECRNDQGQDVSLNGVSLWHLTYAPGRAPELGEDPDLQRDASQREDRARPFRSDAGPVGDPP
jgi:hypothetical protein